MTARPASSFAAAIACAAILLAAASARAATESGQAYFESGVREYNLGHFQEAIVEFEKAYKLGPAPILLFNIAQSHRQLGNKERALFFYRRYLEQAPAAENRREVEQRMKDLTESLQQEKDLKQKPPPGVAGSGSAPASAPTTTPVIVQPSTAPDSPAPGAWSTRRKVAVGLMGAGGAALVTGVTFMFVQNGQVDDYNSAGCAKSLPDQGPAGCSDKGDSADLSKTLSIAGYIGTAVFAGAGVYLFLSDRAGAGSGGAGSPTSITLRCAPSLGAGFACGGTF